MMDPKGHVLCKSEFIHTRLWPDPRFTLHGKIDLEKAYKEALAGKMCKVMDIAVDESSYLLYAESSKVGAFIWDIDKRDTVEGSFIPVIKKYGVTMPANLSPVEEFEYLVTLKMRGAL